jgi:rhodanese-related sulfurtransferase
MRSITEILRYVGLPALFVLLLLTGGFWAATLPSRANQQEAVLYTAGLPTGIWASSLPLGPYVPAPWAYVWNWRDSMNSAAAPENVKQPWDELAKQTSHQLPEIGPPPELVAQRDLTDSEKAQQRTIESLQKDGIGFLTAAALQDKMKSSWHGVVIDVGARSAYAHEHILGAINIPENQIAALAPVVLPDRQTPIVTYCGSTECTASMSAAQQLKSLGYAEVYDFWGGLKSWVAMGLPARGSEVAGR